MNTSLRSPAPSSNAFSLVEVMSVLAIFSMLAVMSTLAFRSVADSANLARGGQQVAEQVALARQEAISRNCQIQLRVYETNDRPGHTAWRELQLWEISQSPSGPAEHAIGKRILLPAGVIISESQDYSPLLFPSPEISGSTESVPYRGFTFQPTGRSSRPASQAFFTLQREQQQNAGSNYYTVQINPMNGKMSVYRP